MKQWNVKVDEKPYNIRFSGSKLLINDEKVKLKSLINRRYNGIFRTYEIPVGKKTAELYIGSYLGGPILVLDGKDCATGEDFVPMKLPKWAYIFIALHFVNFANGALGALLALVGISATISVSANPRFHTGVKVLLDICLLVLSAAVIFGVALALVSI